MSTDDEKQLEECSRYHDQRRERGIQVAGHAGAAEATESHPDFLQAFSDQVERGASREFLLPNGLCNPVTMPAVARESSRRSKL